MKKYLPIVWGLGLMAGAPLADAQNIPSEIGRILGQVGRANEESSRRDSERARDRDSNRGRESDYQDDYRQDRRDRNDDYRREDYRREERGRLVKETRRTVIEPDGDRFVITRRIYERRNGERVVQESRERLDRW